MSPVLPGDVEDVPFLVQGHQGQVGDAVPCPPNKPRGHAEPPTCYWGLGTRQGHGDTRGRGHPRPIQRTPGGGMSPSRLCQRAQDCPQCPQGRPAGCPQAVGDMVRTHQGHQRGRVGDSIGDTGDISGAMLGASTGATLGTSHCRTGDIAGAASGTSLRPPWPQRWGRSRDITRASAGDTPGPPLRTRWGR